MLNAARELGSEKAGCLFLQEEENMILANGACWEYGSCQEILVLRLPTLLPTASVLTSSSPISTYWSIPNSTLGYNMHF